MTRRSRETQSNGIGWQALGTPTSGNLARRDGADHSVYVTYLEVRFDLFAALDRRATNLEQLGDIQRFVESVVLLHLFVTTHLRPEIRLIQNVGEVETVRLPVIDCRLRLQSIHPSDHLINRAEAELRHDFAHLHGDEAHEVDDVLGLASKALAQLRVLRGHTSRAGVEMANSHHDAAHGDERRGRKTELFGT